uniref:Transcriptional regulator n=1 Tax=Thermosporothrix sp. COM3 TaxID=2490863 RepID=A0A455SPF6_9CHLR|nr:transcriptional regulator [Thermosporothrix sp. COM3]
MSTEKKTQRQNFFLLLDINPNEEWDPDKFVKVLKAKQVEWSRKRSLSVGQKASQAQRNLELIPQIRKVMEDDALRAQERDEALKELASQQAARVEVFEKRLEFFNAKESASQTEIDKFIKEFQDLYPEQEIRNRITVTIRAEQQVTRQALEPSRAKAIAGKLNDLNMSSLYELLGCPETTSTRILQQKAEQLYRDVSKIATKTQEVTLKSDLAGSAKDIFSSEDKRKQYDESLRQLKFASLFKVLEEQINQSVEKEITYNQTELFLNEAQQAGWDRQEALFQLKEQAKAHKWLVHVRPAEEKSQKVRCGGCHTLNEADQKFCTQCRQPLFIQCPECNETIRPEANACGHCGFPVGNRYLVEIHLQELQDLFKKRDTQKAQQLLDEMKTLWQPKKADRYSQEIKRFQSELQRLHAELRKVEAHVQQLLNQKKYITAKQYLEGPAAAILPNRAQKLNEIQGELSKVRSLFQRATVATLPNNEKIALCRQALALCPDYQEARDLLRTIPPMAPTNLQAKTRGGIVSLSWQPSSTEGVMYVIVRKSLTQPHSSRDGTVLDTVPGLHYEDSRPETGVPLYYAIFAECEGVPSANGALLEQPLLLLQDVTQAFAEVGNQQVKLSWVPPKNVASVLLVRKQNVPPTSASDGEVIGECVPAQTSFIDRDVQNNQTYYYALYARFKDQHGRLATAPGVRVKAIPEPPPAPIHSLEMHMRPGSTSAEREVELRWTPPAKGKAIILKSTHTLQHYEKKVIAESTLYTLGQLLEDQPDSVVDPKVALGVTYYLPVVLFHKMAYIGTEHRLATVDDVQNVRWQNMNTALRLQWKWPANCQEVIVSSHQLRWPELDDEYSSHTKVSRSEYDRLGYFELRCDKDTDYYIRITALVTQGTEEIPAQGVRLHVHPTDLLTLTYEIKRPTLWRRTPHLHIAADRAGTLPTLRLIGTRDRLPVHKTDGTMICRIEPTSINGRGRTFPLPIKEVAPGTYCKLFLEDDALYQEIDICHPHEDKLRIN